MEKNPITFITVHLMSEKNESGVSSSRSITIYESDGKNTVERLLKTISALHSIVQEYENR